MACVAYGCSNHNGKKMPGMSFHKFPKDKELRAAWTEAVRRENWTPSDHSLLCSKHFKESDIDRNSTMMVFIKRGSVPTIFNDIPTHHQKRKVLKKDPPSATVTQSSLIGGPSVGNIRIKQEPMADDDDIGIQLESVLEVVNTKIKIEPLSDSESELQGPSQNYGWNTVQRSPVRSPILPNPLLEPQCDLQIKSEPSDDAILGVPVEFSHLSSDSERNRFSPSGGSSQSIHEPLVLSHAQSVPEPLVLSHAQSVPEPLVLSYTQSVPEPLVLSLAQSVPLQTAVSDRASPKTALMVENSVSGNQRPISIIPDIIMPEENSMSDSLSDDDDSVPDPQPAENPVSATRERDAFDDFGEFVAKKLRAMDTRKARLVQTKFGDLLYRLETGLWNAKSAEMAEWMEDISKNGVH